MARAVPRARDSIHCRHPTADDGDIPLTAARAARRAIQVGNRARLEFNGCDAGGRPDDEHGDDARASTGGRDGCGDLLGDVAGITLPFR
jgi:hypothetical protein